MSRREGAVDAPTIRMGATSTDIIAPDHVFERIENFYPMEGGGLRSVSKAIPFVPKSSGGAPTNGTLNPTTPVYGTCYGIFCARVLDGQREVTLLHTGSEIWEFRGWIRAWRCIIGPSASSPLLVMELPTPVPTDFPTQWVATPTGVVIIPQGGRAAFYDGITCLPLGYDHAPSPPVGHGPDSTSNEWAPNLALYPFFGVNDSGYTMDGLTGHPPSVMNPIFRRGRKGTIDIPTNITTLAATPADKSQVMGYLMPGRLRCKVQWIDRWGNLSPASGASNEVSWRRQPAMRVVGAPPYTLSWVHADLACKQVAWDSIRPGPPGTIGRILGVTKDLENSGDSNFYQCPLDSTVTPNAFATLPDNMTQSYPDNIPDAWLVLPLVEVDPMPMFRLAELCFGRMFIANAEGEEGAVWYTLIGRWGTVQANSKFYPDPSGAEITGMHRVKGGMLIFTEQSTFLLTPRGDRFEPVPLSTTVGCVAPSTLATHMNGMTIWLSADGYYGYDGSSVQPLFETHHADILDFNRARLRKACAYFDRQAKEYRSWVAIAGSVYNNRCYCLDGATWRTRTDIWAAAACGSEDHRRLGIVAGRLEDADGTTDLEGVWVLDSFGAPVTATAKTSWLTSTAGPDRKSVFRLRVWLRETKHVDVDADRLAIKLRKDYRAEVTETKYLDNLYPKLSTSFNTDSPNPSLWDEADHYGDTGAKWRRRRPYWAEFNLDLGSAEVFQLEMTSTSRVEILGFSFEEKPRAVSGAMSPR